MKRKQCSNRVANIFVLNQVRVDQDGLYADNVLSKIWFGKSYSSQNLSNFLANFATEKVTQVQTTERTVRSFNSKVNLKI